MGGAMIANDNTLGSRPRARASSPFVLPSCLARASAQDRDRLRRWLYVVRWLSAWALVNALVILAGRMAIFITESIR